MNTGFTVAGALVGALLTALVAFSNSRRQRQVDVEGRAMTRAAQQSAALTERVSNYLGATWYAVLELRYLAIAPAEDKEAIERDRVWGTLDRVNSALVAIEINDSETLVDAARDLDRAMVQLLRDAGSQVYAKADWRDHRTASLSAPLVELKRLARAKARI